MQRNVENPTNVGEQELRLYSEHRNMGLPGQLVAVLDIPLMLLVNEGMGKREAGDFQCEWLLACDISSLYTMYYIRSQFCIIYIHASHLDHCEQMGMTTNSRYQLKLCYSS